MKLLVQLTGKFLCVIWNLVTKTYQKFVTLRSLKNFQKSFINAKKLKKILIDFKKLINLFEIKKE